MNAFERDKTLSLRQAAELLPGKPNRSTMHRWAHHGVRGVRLATILIGGRRYTTREAIEQFVAALSKQEEPGDAA
jgi:hypothetical protein